MADLVHNSKMND